MNFCRLCGRTADKTINIEKSENGEVKKYDICNECYLAFEAISNPEHEQYAEKNSYLANLLTTFENEDELTTFVKGYMKSCEENRNQIVTDDAEVQSEEQISEQVDDIDATDVVDNVQEDDTANMPKSESEEQIVAPTAFSIDDLMQEKKVKQKKFDFNSFIVNFFKSLSIFIAIFGMAVAFAASRQVVSDSAGYSMFFSQQATTRVIFDWVNFFDQYITYVVYSIVSYTAAEIIGFIKKEK